MSTVLVVEDETLVRMATAMVIRNAGFPAIEAKDASVALEILRTRSDISLVFTDVDMPGPVNGLKLAEMVHLGMAQHQDSCHVRSCCRSRPRPS